MYEQLLAAHPDKARIYVICDNACYYKNKDLRQWLADKPICQVFLPPYWPNLNLERFQSQCTGYFSNMKAYSDDLRQRVAAACGTPGRSLAQVAAQFTVSLSFVEKLRRRQRTSGSVAALPHRGGPQPRLDEDGRAKLVHCVSAQPDATLEELHQHLLVAGGPAVGCTTLWSALQQLDWRRKKRVFTPLSAIPNG